MFAGQNTEEEFNDIWSIEIQGEHEKELRANVSCSFAGPSVIGFDPTPLPRVRYTTSMPVPAPRKIIPPTPPAAPKPRDLEELRKNYIKKMNEMFDTLKEQFQNLDMLVPSVMLSLYIRIIHSQSHCNS